MSLYKWDTKLYDIAKERRKRVKKHFAKNTIYTTLLDPEELEEILNMVNTYNAGLQCIINTGVIHVRDICGTEYWIKPLRTFDVAEDYKHVISGFYNSLMGQQGYIYPYKSQRIIILS